MFIGTRCHKDEAAEEECPSKDSASHSAPPELRALDEQR